jgi:uncharacterized protein YbjT (DUF2867 family)
MSPQPHTAGHQVAVPASDVGPILVIGATGMVGRHVVRQLSAAGHRPRALVRDPSQARQRLGDHAESFAGTLDRPDMIGASLTGIDRVFLLTSQTSRQPEHECAVIRAAARGQVRHVVKLSVFRADEHSSLQVARQHRQTERALEQSGLAYTILRPVFFMQNLFGMLRHGSIRTATGHGRVAMIDARDIASAAVTTLTSNAHDGRTYTLTGPKALSFDEVATILGAQTGIQIRHMGVSPMTCAKPSNARASSPGSPTTWPICRTCSPPATRTSSPTTFTRSPAGGRARWHSSPTTLRRPSPHTLQAATEAD